MNQILNEPYDNKVYFLTDKDTSSKMLVCGNGHYTYNELSSNPLKSGVVQISLDGFNLKKGKGVEPKYFHEFDVINELVHIESDFSNINSYALQMSETSFDMRVIVEVVFEQDEKYKKGDVLVFSSWFSMFKDFNFNNKDNVIIMHYPGGTSFSKIHYMKNIKTVKTIKNRLGVLKYVMENGEVYIVDDLTGKTINL